MIKHEFTGDITRAEINDCALDAVRVITRRYSPIKEYIEEQMERTGKSYSECLTDSLMGSDIFGLQVALIKDTFKAVTKRIGNDTYSEKVGRTTSDIKLLNKYDKAVESAIRKWVTHNQKVLHNNVLNLHMTDCK